MFQFEIYCALSSGKNDVNDVAGGRDFVYLSDILEHKKIRYASKVYHRSTHLAHKNIQEHLSNLVAIGVPL